MNTPSRKNFVNLHGLQFGKLTVQGYAGKTAQGRSQWDCTCECGNSCVVRGDNLTTGNTVSCGCLLVDSHVTHGGKYTPEYTAYINAKDRCLNTNHKSFDRYGGRGIQFRFPSFETFLAVVGKRPSPQHTLDRKDNNGHYEPGNLRWATQKTQVRNRDCTVRISALGETLTLGEWSEKNGIPLKAIRARRRRGWCDECSVSKELGGKCNYHH